MEFKDERNYIYKVTISKVGFNSGYEDYFVASDVTAIYNYYNSDFLHRIVSIECLGALFWIDNNFFEDNDTIFSLYQFEYWGKLNSECKSYVVASKIQDVHTIVSIDPKRIIKINKINTIRYLKTFKEIDDEIEEMRIG